MFLNQIGEINIIPVPASFIKIDEKFAKILLKVLVLLKYVQRFWQMFLICDIKFLIC